MFHQHRSGGRDGPEDQLYRQINSALNIGVTPDEVHEALIQVSCYGGVSAGSRRWASPMRCSSSVGSSRPVMG